MEDNPTFAGIGSTAYIILKADLQPDTLTPKEGKQWHEIDLHDRTSVQVGSAATTAAPVPSASPKGFRQSFTMTAEVRGNWSYRPPRAPHFRRRRLHNKFVNRLARYIVIWDSDRIISSRKASHNLNRAIKQLKRKQT